MTTANKITLLRIALIPFFLFFALRPDLASQAVALLLFLIASLTDFLDGYIARKYHQITDFGKFVDPLADKLMVSAALLVFVERGLMSAVLVFLILAREFMITALRTVAMSKGRVMAATWTGKVKTCTQIACIAVIFLCSSLSYPIPIPIAAWAMTLATLYSGWDYMHRNWDIVAQGATKQN